MIYKTGSSNKWITIKSESEKNILRIPQVSKEDEGSYSCVANNGFSDPGISTDFRIFIKGMNAWNSRFLFHGDSFILIRWESESGFLGPVVWYLSRTSLNYCVVCFEGSRWSIWLPSSYWPRFTELLLVSWLLLITIANLLIMSYSNSPSKDHTLFIQSDVKVGDRVTATCFAEGLPPFSISWLKDGHNYDARSNNVKIESGEETSIIILKNVKDDDGGNYTCSVRNSYGSASYTSALVIKGMQHPFIWWLTDFQWNQVHLNGSWNQNLILKLQKEKRSRWDVKPRGILTRLSPSRK